ncbi:hypothetical protein ARMSODRAFT_1037721 [Armillaria solidipes]|uniref:Uncharacterized protein n=1 Tax=Armillaria solidipes TaxID=1076256 RepID=A0A2H3AH94_9AGAR|nr:hypothetical protein ARMSODRAFT_1037721 [Armillaria solidipes]
MSPEEFIYGLDTLGHSASPPNSQPTNVMPRSRNSPDAWPNDALFHGIDEETDATNVFSGQKLNDSSFPDALQISFDSDEQSWDHGVELGGIDGEYEITAVRKGKRYRLERNMGTRSQASISTPSLPGTSKGKMKEDSNEALSRAKKNGKSPAKQSLKTTALSRKRLPPLPSVRNPTTATITRSSPFSLLDPAIRSQWKGTVQELVLCNESKIAEMMIGRTQRPWFQEKAIRPSILIKDCGTVCMALNLDDGTLCKAITPIVLETLTGHRYNEANSRAEVDKTVP